MYLSNVHFEVAVLRHNYKLPFKVTCPQVHFKLTLQRYLLELLSKVTSLQLLSPSYMFKAPLLFKRCSCKIHVHFPFLWLHVER